MSRRCCRLRFGVNAWAGLAAGIAMGALVGWIIGFLSFRAGLRGSYFALVTLAFAEVLRILANATGFTGGAAGLLLKLDLGFANLQFSSRAQFLWLALGFVALRPADLAAHRRHALRRPARRGARERGCRARRSGVDVLTVKLRAIAHLRRDDGGGRRALSRSISSISTRRSPMASGSRSRRCSRRWSAVAGWCWARSSAPSPCMGSARRRKAFAGRVPGIDLMVYGGVLIVVVAFAPGGVLGLLDRLRPKSRRKGETA